MTGKNRVTTALLASMLVWQTGIAEIEDNADYQDAYEAWAAAHFALLPTSFLPGPVGSGADLASIGIDVRIKTLPATLIAPTPDPVTPDSPDGCHYDFLLPQMEAEYENLFGLADIKPLTTNWGALSNPSPPQVGHANAAVDVRVANEYLDSWTEDDKIVVFPSGDHPMRWSANTQLDPLIDVTIPFALFVITNEVKYLKSFFSLQTNPATAARALEIGGLFLINAGIEAGLIAAGQIESNLPVDSAEHVQFRPFTVYDINPPTIFTSDPNPEPLEATSFGGERWQLHKDRFTATITADDPCGQPILVGNDAPVLLPLGTTQVTWEALDTGPVGPGNPGRATAIQQIVVQDTKPPIILAPPSRVIESASPATTDDFDIGAALVFDLADPEPTTSNTVGTDFPVDQRTEVLWSATDSSGNASTKSQWITVKTPGTNQAPSVSDVNANALTSEVIDLELMGSDPDLLSGRFDPLKFEIVSLPAGGFFVAPLVPYFIEDFRVRPTTEVGEILNTSGNPSADLYDLFCDANPSQPIPTDFVYQPEFVHVTDDGISFVLDRYWRCDTGGSSAVTEERLSKWSSSGDLLNQIDVASTIKRLTLDADGFAYTVRPGTASDALFLTKYDQDFNSIQSWRLDANTPFGTPPRLLGARMDSDTGLIYATNKDRVFVYDGNDGQFIPAYLGTLKDGEAFLSGAPSIAGSSSRGFYIEVDSSGAVYIVDSGMDRIHKFAPSTFDGNTFVAGEHIGWMGRCDSGPGCDVPNGRSFGYSCNDTTTCDVVQANGSNCGPFISGPCTLGSGPGQFYTPIGIALDHQDMLYVTDYDNSRVQRFTALGDFSGEAASTCDGTCFVLGDMGRPLDISVNSSQFYVLDRDRDLMHVFETAPFQDITDDSVIVSYASDNDFQGVDTFTYRANDGLTDSNLGTATITVERNFRPPEAFDDTVSLDEDSSASVLLLADDPDGIDGIDFNGLDTLTYEIVQGPTNGTLSGSDESRMYTPDQDFSGQDSIVFRVNDGVFDSALATVTLDVQPVNDPPITRFTDDQSRLLPKALWPLLQGKIIGANIQAGLGYPIPLMAEFEDPDTGQSHFVQIIWGDGTTDSANQNPPSDPMNHEGPILTNTFNSVGQIAAEHVYMTPGIKTVNVTVIDETGAGSDGSNSATADIEVIPMIDIALEAMPEDPDNPADPGQPATLIINVSNEPPADPIKPLAATNVEFIGTVPDGVQLMSISTTKGNCIDQNGTTTCQLGTMQPEDVVTITVILLPDLDFNPEAAGYEINATSTEPDASFDNVSVVEIPVLREVLFSNGFE